MKRKLIIAPYLGQRVLFKKYRNDDVFSDTKFITKEELIANYYYSYSDDAIKFIIKESSIYVLFEMGEELMMDNVWIKRL